MRRRAALVPLALATALAGCGSGPDPASQRAAAQADQTVRPAATGVRLKKVGTFSRPTHVTAPPGDTSRLFVVEQEGRIRVRHDGESSTFVDLRSIVACCGERGLLSMAFAPDYAESRRFYLFYVNNDGDIRVDQLRRSASDPNVADPDSRRRVLRIEHSQYPNHFGGQLHFGPDGMLYVSTGDGGGARDPLRNGQRLSSVLGKILRIDPQLGGGYDVPGSNPFVDREGARDEIWAYGLRNPFRFSFDRATGDLVLGDVGQDDWDEVDFSKSRGRGANFGWSVYEGHEKVRSGSAPGHDPPAIVNRLGSNGNCALIGGYVVRDPALEGLVRRYLWGDNCNPSIYSSRLGSSGASSRRNTGLSLSRLSSFGEDAAGRVYVTSLNGGVYRLKPQ